MVNHIVWGLVIFGLFILYDINSVKWKNKWIHTSFLAGCLLLVTRTLWLLWRAGKEAALSWKGWCLLGLALVFLGLLIYTLFFALPFEKTYLSQGEKPVVYDQGMYALCRHPGVLWFFLFYCSLGLALSGTEVLTAGLIFSFMNFLYVVFQDLWTFPRTFEDYGVYQKKTPFLIPSLTSMKAAFHTWGR